MERKIDVIDDFNGRKIVFIHDIIFKKRQYVEWKDVKEYLKKYVGENNNKHSYYEDFVGGTVVIRKNVYDKYIKDHFMKFFAYSEKWTPSTGYADETAFHFELEDGNITRKYYNYLDNHTQKVEEDSGHCEECPYGFLKKDYGESPFLKFLKDYGMEEDGTDV